MDFAQARFNMVEQQIRPWDVLDFDVLDALAEIPREAFVTEAQQTYAYADLPLPLPNGGTMLEPKIVARLVQGLALKAGESVLEIGTGSGFATALLAKLAGSVTTVDVDGGQQERAKAVLESLSLQNIEYVQADGLAKSVGQFDAIYVGGALHAIPDVLVDQLKEGGRLVAAVGEAPVQRARLLTKQGGKLVEKTLFDTFVSYLESSAAPAPSRFRF